MLLRRIIAPPNSSGGLDLSGQGGASGRAPVERSKSMVRTSKSSIRSRFHAFPPVRLSAFAFSLRCPLDFCLFSLLVRPVLSISFLLCCLALCFCTFSLWLQRNRLGFAPPSFLRFHTFSLIPLPSVRHSSSPCGSSSRILQTEIAVLLLNEAHVSIKI